MPRGTHAFNWRERGLAPATWHSCLGLACERARTGHVAPPSLNAVVTRGLPPLPWCHVACLLSRGDTWPASSPVVTRGRYMRKGLAEMVSPDDPCGADAPPGRCIRLLFTPNGRGNVAEPWLLQGKANGARRGAKQNVMTCCDRADRCTHRVRVCSILSVRRVRQRGRRRWRSARAIRCRAPRLPAAAACPDEVTRLA